MSTLATWSTTSVGSWSAFDVTQPKWSAAALIGVAQVFGDTEHGFTGPQIEAMLAQLNIPDPGPITATGGDEKVALRTDATQCVPD